MKLLLDTHIWLWSLLSPEKLRARSVAELSRRENELWLSPVSVWEALILAHKGRIELKPTADTWVSTALAAGPFQEAPLNFEVARESRKIQLPHDDPADRFLAATASVYDLTLLTDDARLLRAGGFRHLANR